MEFKTESDLEKEEENIEVVMTDLQEKIRAKRGKEGYIY